MTKVRDVQPGQHFRRPDVNDGTRVLVKLANPHNSGHNGADHFSFDPENFELIGSYTGSNTAVPVDPLRTETRNHISFSDSELRYIEAVMANVNHGPLWDLNWSIVKKVHAFLPSVANRKPCTFAHAGKTYTLGNGPVTTIREQE